MALLASSIGKQAPKKLGATGAKALPVASAPLKTAIAPQTAPKKVTAAAPVAPAQPVAPTIAMQRGGTVIPPGTPKATPTTVSGARGGTVIMPQPKAPVNQNKTVNQAPAAGFKNYTVGDFAGVNGNLKEDPNTKVATGKRLGSGKETPVDTTLNPPVGVPNGPAWLNMFEPGAVNELYPEMKDALSEPTNSQGVADQTIDDLLGPGKTDDFSNDALDKLKGDPAIKAWLDANMSGLMETPFADWWAQYGDQLSNPTMGEEFAAGAIPGLNDQGFGESFVEGAIGDAYGNNPEIGARSGQMFDELGNLIPDLPIDPNLGAYYDRAKARAADTINTELAARGAYGSSGGLGRLSDAMVGLEAERANREAQYGLDRAAELRGWQGLRSETGAAADLNDVRRSSEERLWLSNLMDSALAGDELALERVQTAGDLGFRAGDQALERFGQQTEGQQAASQEELDRFEAGMEAVGQLDETEVARIIAGSGVATAADAQEVQRAIAASQIASTADAETLKRWIAIYNAAEGSSEEKLRAADLYFSQNLAYGNATGGTIGEAADDIEGIDMGLTDAELAAILGARSEDVSGAINARQMNADDRARFMDELAQMMELGGMFS